MSAQAGIEATIDAMIAKLKDPTSGLEAKITALNASDYTDAWPLPDIDQANNIVFGSRAEITYPFVCLDPSGSASIGDLTGNLYRSNSIAVTTYIADPTEEGIRRLLIRFQRAVFETLLLMRRPGVAQNVGGYGLSWEGDRYGPTFGQASGDGEFASWVQSLFTVRQEQTI